ncbi:hypothetical protein CO116_03630 [Candidatus Falkowbacteria bacterium CG_4_9_14_3_um_filter_38_19]|uniref:DUF5667 domain-containing protein n=1 Tax=Candidatus Falkowbacteria bacterium CG_4_9_14_3_um_filter_38_19 TaxID=1974559 RepID=A0A2M8AD44_9BACT|nr:MAG: hypothetical protein CO116_03630 [Candidatus Falkowbacteria bacterium CG_4_9_14_3_um_filter_38_19]
MDDKEILKKLNNLKTIKPDNQWKNNYRQVLFSQISSGQAEIDKGKEDGFSWKVFFGDLIPQGFKFELVKPIWISILVIFILLGGGLVSVYASLDTKPGDSLYIAKVISEKAQFAITFNEKGKAKLNLEFATNRAEEINQLLKESTALEQDKNKKVQQLSLDFKRELNQAKSRLNKIDNTNKIKINNNEEVQYFGANLGKDDQRMEVSEPAKQEIINNQANENNAAPENQLSATATTTENSLVAAEEKSAGQILEEAEKLFDEKNYDGSINKLREINTVIDQAGSGNQGEVQGASESATSTE